MESVQSLKRRIKSTKNIGQITKAMELVAATKMRKSQQVALDSRPYSFTALDLLANLVSIPKLELPLILKTRETKKTLVVIITSDKGLAGAFNSAVFRTVEAYLSTADLSVHAFVAVGIKSIKFLERKGIAPVETFVKVGDMTELDEVIPLANHATAGFLAGKWDRVIVYSTHFRTALRQEVAMRELLPIDTNKLKNSVREIIPEHGRFAELHTELEAFMIFKHTEYIIEPSATELLTVLVPHLIQMQFYFLILEANASEHAARRLAMESASNNAEDLGSRLTKEFNKSRQALITREIIEVTSGAAAL